MTDSPCVDVCEVEGDECVACGRTLEQLAVWGSLSDAERREIMDDL